MMRFGAARDTARALWRLGIYPVAGTVEVVFQYLKRRPPFDDEPLRRELMTRLNGIEGIDLAEAKLDLRPSFPLEVFSGHGEEICAVLERFARTAPRPRPVAGRTTIRRPRGGGMGADAPLRCVRSENLWAPRTAEHKVTLAGRSAAARAADEQVP
ncbi:hypothetical protein ACFZAE_36730 [Streptomyces scabiei]|uniref:hypothetical protein n=1 Tax=Streptomyces scabiei TaxID=1930 RepID=UPI0036E0BDDA